MIKLEKTDIYGWATAIRGCRNPMNSWNKSDTRFNWEIGRTVLGKNDLALMQKLARAGDDHAKYLRMINVTVDITAPLYWWKEFDTYKVGTVANSCSTMHKIQAKEFTLDDCSYEHLHRNSLRKLQETIEELNFWRDIYNNGGEVDNGDGTVSMFLPKDKYAWWQMIQLLPSSYNQKRTIQFNYQVLKNMYFARKHHKLDEWRAFCAWCENLSYFKEIILGAEN